MAEKGRVFISHRPEDAAYARELGDALTMRAFTAIYFDPKSGADTESQLKKALEQASVYLALVSEPSSWLYFELGAAVQDEKPIILALLSGEARPFLTPSIVSRAFMIDARSLPPNDLADVLATELAKSRTAE